jgi:hypothetical protein
VVEVEVEEEVEDPPVLERICVDTRRTTICLYAVFGWSSPSGAARFDTTLAFGVPRRRHVIFRLPRAATRDSSFLTRGGRQDSLRDLVSPLVKYLR